MSRPVKGRLRSLHPEMISDAARAGLSDAAFRLFVMLFMVADDYGNVALAELLWSAREGSPAFPGKTPHSLGEFRGIRGVLLDIASAHTVSPFIAVELIRIYRVNALLYVNIGRWNHYQSVHKPSKQIIPPCSTANRLSPSEIAELWQDSCSSRASDLRDQISEGDLGREIQEGNPLSCAHPETQSQLTIPALTPAVSALAISDPKLRFASKGSKKRVAEGSESERADMALVFSKLSERTGRAYGGDKDHRRLVLTLFRSGYTAWDLRRVIGYCGDQLGWSNDPQMEKYLRPQTLFGPRKFGEYIGDARIAFPFDAPSEPATGTGSTSIQVEPANDNALPFDLESAS